MIEKNIFEIFKDIALKQVKNPSPNCSVLSKIGEIFQEIFFYLVSNNKNVEESKRNYEMIMNDHPLMEIIKEFIDNAEANERMTPVIQIFIALYSRILVFFGENIVDATSKQDVLFHLEFCLDCTEKLNSNSDCLFSILTLIGRFLENKYFKLLILDQNEDLGNKIFSALLGIIKDSSFLNCCEEA